MATSQLHTAPLKERIAALQGKVAGATAQEGSVPSRSHSPLPGSSTTTGTPGQLPGAVPLGRTGTVRDKAARFEKKGGMPVPRGAFGMSLPPEHAVKEVRRGELWGNRLPELGRGVVTATHSRNVSQSYSDVSFGGEDDERHSSHSRSASPLPGQDSSVSGRRRTNSSFAGSSSFRRMSSASGGYDHESRFSASNPDLTDPHGDKSLNIPPVPPLPASVVEARQNPVAAAEVERASSDGHGERAVTPELGTAPTVPTAAEGSAAMVPPAAVETTAAVALTAAEDTAPPSPITVPPVPALRVEVADTVDAGPRSVITRFNIGSSLPAQSDQEEEPESPLFYVPPGKPSGIPTVAVDGELALTSPSCRSPPPPSLQFNNRRSTDSNSLTEPRTSLSTSEPATPSEILTPSTMDAFPTPPTVSPQNSPRKGSDSKSHAPSSRTSAPAPPPSGALPMPPSAPVNQTMKPPIERRTAAAVSNQISATSRPAGLDEDEDEVPPPLPPKDESFGIGRRNERGTRKSSVDSSRTSETSHVSHTLPITPPSTVNVLGTTGVKRPATPAPRKPLVVPNWWEDDEDQPATTGWVRVVSRQ